MNNVNQLNKGADVFTYFSDNLAFATIPVLASLANLMGNYERLPANIPQEIRVWK